MDNILGKLPLRLSNLLVSEGIDVTIANSSRGVYLDLNTDMKSHLYLYYENSRYVAACRYNEEFTVETLGDLHQVILNCYTNFMNPNWQHLYDEGFGILSSEGIK
jgi:hypothetical protein